MNERQVKQYWAQLVLGWEIAQSGTLFKSPRGRTLKKFLCKNNTLYK